MLALVRGSGAPAPSAGPRRGRPFPEPAPEMMQTLFGMTLPVSPTLSLDAGQTARLGRRMTEAVAVLRDDDAPVALVASLRQDAQRYLAARRDGTLRLAGFAATRSCDETARAVLRLTMNAPAVRPAAEPLVA